MTETPEATSIPETNGGQNQTPAATGFRLTEDWLATLIGLGLVLTIGVGLLRVGALLPWPLFGIFGG